MAFRDGFYKVTFGTPLGSGSGVALLANGKLHGGDSMMAYVGSYEVDGESVTATVRVFTHSNQPGMQSTLGVPAATLSLSGKAEGGGATLSGSAPQAPQARLTLRLTPIEG